MTRTRRVIADLNMLTDGMEFGCGMPLVARLGVHGLNAYVFLELDSWEPEAAVRAGARCHSNRR